MTTLYKQECCFLCFPSKINAETKKKKVTFSPPGSLFRINHVGRDEVASASPQRFQGRQTSLIWRNKSIQMSVRDSS